MAEPRDAEPDSAAITVVIADDHPVVRRGLRSLLDTLPGVGPVTAQAIIAWRTKHGRFSQVAELQEVDGIGPKTYADLAGRVRL